MLPESPWSDDIFPSLLFHKNTLATILFCFPDRNLSPDFQNFFLFYFPTTSLDDDL